MSEQNPYHPPEVDEDVVKAGYSCPSCGSECEIGSIHALGSISWFPEMSSFKMARPEKISGKGLHLETRLNAFRCNECETITVNLAQEE